MRFIVNTPGFNFKQRGFDMPEMADCCAQEKSQNKFPVKMELIEGKDAFTINAELPGMTKDDIKINIENEILTISGERKQDKNGNENILLSERFFGRFRRDYRIGNRVDTGSVNASFDNGILTLTLPLKEEVKPKNIEVMVH